MSDSFTYETTVAVAMAGDVDGDGFDDLLIGSLAEALLFRGGPPAAD